MKKITITFTLIILVNLSAFCQDTLFNAGAIWKYNDLGVDLGSAWKDINFNDATWNQGNAPLGYGLTGLIRLPLSDLLRAINIRQPIFVNG